MNNLKNNSLHTYNYGNIPVRPRYRRRQRKQNKFPWFLVVLCVLLGACFYLLNYKLNTGYAMSEKPSKTGFDFSINFSPKRQNILLMGVDVAPNSTHPFKGNRSDTMLLISVAPYGKNVNVISIPRDSKVYISGKNKTDKINHAFAFGGARLAVRTVEDSFGVKINHYVAISNEGVIKLIDTLDGLPIYVEKDMKYDDYSAKLHINLKKGNQVLNGKQTEGYLRFRHDNYGDIGRIHRQQWFFNALLARLKDPSVIVKLPEILKVMPEYIQTDLSGYDLAKYVGMAKNIDTSTIQVATIPGTPSTKGVISYWIVDPEKTQALIDKMIYRNKTDIDPKDLSIGILYATSQETKAQKLKEELENRGISVKMRSSSSVSKGYIAVHNLDITGDMVAEIKKTIPEIKDEHTIFDPIGINRMGKDLTIVIAGS